MKTGILPLSSALALVSAATVLRADVMIINFDQPGVGQGFGPGIVAGTIFSTGPERSRVNSVTLEHWFYDAASPPQHFLARVYQPFFTPGNSSPTMVLIGELGNPTVDPTPTELPGLLTFVDYSPAADLFLEASTDYAIIVGETFGAPENPAETAVELTSSSSYDAAAGWSLGGDVWGLDVGGGAYYWWPFTAHLEFAVDASPAPLLNQPPDISNARASVAVLWPPDNQMTPFQIVGVTDPDGDPVSIAVTGIQQDEPAALGKQGPDAVIGETGKAAVRATRLGKGNGRVYIVSFTATDGKPGGSANGVVFISVPHDQGHPVAIDDGPVTGYFNSTGK